MPIGQNDSFLELLIRQESKIAELYQVFSEHHPEYRGFWSSMADAERRHVAMIRELRAFIPSRQALLVEGRVRAGAVKTFLSYIEGLLLRTRTEGMPFPKALSISVDIEKSLIEKGMLDHFLGASAEMTGVLERLRSETAEHAATMEEMRKRHHPSS